MKIVIIEDEPLMADALEEAILRVDPESEISAKLPGIKASLDYFKEGEIPDLFFSDIELSDGLSFEIFKKLDLATPIIFCTAYNHYALEAFRVYGIDYVLKPFQDEDIKLSLQKFRNLKEQSRNVKGEIANLLDWMDKKENASRGSILVHQGDKIIPIKSLEISLVQLKSGIVYVYRTDGKSFPTQYKIDRIHAILGDHSFFKVNRQYIINRNAISHVSQYFARKLLIHPKLKVDEQLIVSKARASLFLRWLEAN